MVGEIGEDPQSATLIETHNRKVQFSDMKPLEILKGGTTLHESIGAIEQDLQYSEIDTVEERQASAARSKE